MAQKEWVRRSALLPGRRQIAWGDEGSGKEPGKAPAGFSSSSPRLRAAREIRPAGHIRNKQAPGRAPAQP